MKYPKPVTAHTEILVESFFNGAIFKGRKNRSLMGVYIGTIDHPIMDDLDGGFITAAYPAVQIPTGEILWVDDDNVVHSCGMYDYINWGKFLDDTPVDQRTSRPRPNGLYPFPAPVSCAIPSEESSDVSDELPF